MKKKGNVFQSVRTNKIKRTAFDLSHEKKMSFEMGKLQPLLVQEVVPGDSFNVKAEIMLRMAPLIAPIMHRVNVFTHFFFVPNRLVWDSWKEFITGNEDLLVPSFDLRDNSEYLKKGDLLEAMGLPALTVCDGISSVPISKLPIRAYNLIFNEYYRDQNLIDEVDLDQTKVLTRAWEKDYFTSALPFAQKGGEATIPMELTPNYKSEATFHNVIEPTPSAGGLSVNNGTDYTQKIITANGTGEIHNLDAMDGEISINELRLAERLQRWLEKNARAGSRYVEHLMAHWGVRSSDARLQRPEYLGGGKNPVVISEVLSTAETTDLPQGNMSGHAVSVGSSNNFQKFFEEHGFVIGIVSVLPRTAYQQGVDKMFTRVDKFDFYFPEFAHLGEQEVKNYELFLDPADSTNQGTFGYQSRWAEMKYKQSLVTGDFRDNLKQWHMSRRFSALPALNQSFVESDPTKEIFAVVDPDYDSLWCQAYLKVIAQRPMPYYGTPKL